MHSIEEHGSTFFVTHHLKTRDATIFHKLSDEGPSDAVLSLDVSDREQETAARPVLTSADNTSSISPNVTLFFPTATSEISRKPSLIIRPACFQVV